MKRAARRNKKPRGAKRRIRWRRFLPALFCLALLSWGAGHLIAYQQDSRAVERTNAQLRSEYESAMEAAPTVEIAPAPVKTPAPTAPAPLSTLLSQYQYIAKDMLSEMRDLYAKNDDIVGWLRIPGVVSLPVVYRDNSYYLTHDFYGKKSKAGALFLDQKHPLRAGTQYLVIHGHNMADGSMFGLLSHYRKPRYIREHGIVSFSTLYRKEKYVAFAVLLVPEDVKAAGYVAYTGTPAFQTAAQFEAFVETIRENSLYNVPIEVSPSDALMALSTCWADNRLIVVCRRVRENETIAELQQKLTGVE